MVSSEKPEKLKSAAPPKKTVVEEKEDHGGPSVLSETIEKIALEVDYHGLADLYEASSWYAKLFWTVIVIGALGAVIHDCYNIITLFSSNPSATKISEYQVKELELPNVTICNMGIFNQTELRARLAAAGEPDIKKQNDFVNYMMIMGYQKPPGDLPVLAKNYTMPQQKIWDTMIKDVNQSIQFLKDTAYQCDGFLSDCQYEEREFPCCKDDIFVFTDLGGCYTLRFNSSPGPIYQRGRDNMAGISVTTTMDITEIAILEEWKSVGLRLQFGDYVSPFDFSSMLHLPPGMLALVRLSPVKYVLDSAVTDCWLTAPTLVYHDGYGPGLCKHDCVLEYTVKTCGCMPYGYSYTNAEKWDTCTIEQMRTCVLPQVWHRDDGQDPPEVQACKRSKCLRMCSYWVHEPYLMLSQLKSDTKDKVTNRRQNVLNVYFGNMRYTQTEAAKLMTFDTFVSNLGGAIGLWTGMSLISMVQILVYGWEGFWRMVERRRAEQMIQSMLAQHPAHGQTKPIQVKNITHINTAQTKNGQPKFEEAHVRKRHPGSVETLSFVTRLKSIFRPNGVFQQRETNDNGFFKENTMTNRVEDLPPDPKPRTFGKDGQRNVSKVIEQPSKTVADTGKGAPAWNTKADRNQKPSFGQNGNSKEYTEPFSPQFSTDSDEQDTASESAGSQRRILGQNQGRGNQANAQRDRSRSRPSPKSNVTTTTLASDNGKKKSTATVDRHPVNRPKY